jgi:hypothetical protein
VNDQPWDFPTAHRKCQQASAAQIAVEKALKEAYAAFAEAEEKYRKALAGEIVRAHADGIAWSAAPDLARGDDRVARLRRDRDIAEGLREAMQQSAWRRAADRRDAARFADWSMRRDLAEGYGDNPQPQWSKPIGARA